MTRSEPTNAKKTLTLKKNLTLEMTLAVKRIPVTVKITLTVKRIHTNKDCLKHWKMNNLSAMSPALRRLPVIACQIKNWNWKTC
jgi:hypothetical protein